MDRQGLDAASEQALRLVWTQTVNAARNYLAETYTTSGGVEKKKRKADKITDQIVLDTLARILWVLSGHRKTPHYWYMEAIGAAKDKDRSPL
jgi:hypothetical protein